MLVRAWLLAAALVTGSPAWSQIAVPALSGRVVDQTGTLTAGQITTLSQRLESFEARKGSQVAVLLIPTTAPETIEQFSIRVADQWKLGRKKVDDGAILVVAKDDRALRIEVGYGLEGALNDAISNRIIDETILPRFKRQDFAGGIEAGVGQMLAVIDGEPPPRSWREGDARGGQPYFPVIFGLVIVLAAVLPALLGRLGGSLAAGALVAGVTWLLAGGLWIAIFIGIGAMVFTLVRGNGLLNGWAGGYRGYGGGRGGGGFSGGGGGFGGGGASGRW